MLAFLNPKTDCRGTRLTIKYADSVKKPNLCIEISPETNNLEKFSLQIVEFVKKNKINILNIAGHRESTCGFKEYCKMVKIILENSLDKFIE